METDELEPLWLLLSDDERSRVDRCRSSQLQNRFVAVRGNLRIILGNWLGCLPQEVRFGYGDRGKPQIDADYFLSYRQSLPTPDVALPHFNLTHSQDWALYVVSGDRSVGIDLEYVDYRRDVLGLARRFFAESERIFLDRIAVCGDHHSVHRHFFRAWTLKEAYGKATGQGISHLLAEVDVSPLLAMPLESSMTFGTTDQKSPQWQMRSLGEGLPSAILKDYRAAVCYSL